MRYAVGPIILLTALGLVVRTWLVQGVLVPFEVTSGSMAPGLLGVHRDVVCGGCGYPFACGTDLRNTRREAICPNCGAATGDLRWLAEISGDRLLISRAAFLVRPPRRWEVVAFRSPEEASQIVVKRIVGLPGEAIQLGDGDVYVNGAIARKTLDEQRAMAVPVYDAAYAPRDGGLPSRWQSEPGSGWRREAGRFTHRASGKQDTIGWLTYHHGIRRPDDQAGQLETPITNACSYNQFGFEHGEDLSPVRDLLLEFRLIHASGRGRLLVRAADGADQWLVRIQPADGTFDVLRNSQPLKAGHRPLGARLENLRVEISLIDRQFLVALNGRPALVYPCEPSAQEPSPVSRPFAIGSEGLDVAIDGLRLFRDVYYTQPAGVSGRWGLDRPCQLSEDEYFVLGDNSAVSDDSRTWPQGAAVGGQLLIGRPLVVDFPGRRLNLGGWQVQVPDLGRIRYIR